jgi:hypothetical protein
MIVVLNSPTTLADGLVRARVRRKGGSSQTPICRSSDGSCRSERASERARELDEMKTEGPRSAGLRCL